MASSALNMNIHGLFGLLEKKKGRDRGKVIQSYGQHIVFLEQGGLWQEMDSELLNDQPILIYKLSTIVTYILLSSTLLLHVYMHHEPSHTCTPLAEITETYRP